MSESTETFEDIPIITEKFEDFSNGVIFSDYAIAICSFYMAFLLYNYKKSLRLKVSKEKIKLIENDKDNFEYLQVDCFYLLNITGCIFFGLFTLCGGIHHHLGQFGYEKESLVNIYSWKLGKYFGDLFYMLYAISPSLLFVNFTSKDQVEGFVNFCYTFGFFYGIIEFFLELYDYGIIFAAATVTRLSILIAFNAFNFKEDNLSAYFKFNELLGYASLVLFLVGAAVYSFYKPDCQQELAHSKGCIFPDACNHNCFIHIINCIVVVMQYSAFL